MIDEDPMQMLCRRLLAVLDENVDLRHLVLDVALGMPLDDSQRALLAAVSEDRWSR